MNLTVQSHISEWVFSWLIWDMSYSSHCQQFELGPLISCLTWYQSPWVPRLYILSILGAGFDFEMCTICGVCVECRTLVIEWDPPWFITLYGQELLHPLLISFGVEPPIHHYLPKQGTGGWNIHWLKLIVESRIKQFELSFKLNVPSK